MSVAQTVVLEVVIEPVVEETGVVIDQGIVVPVFWRSVQQKLALALLACEVAVDEVHEFCHGHVFLFEDADVHSCQRVGNVCRAGHRADREGVESGSLLQDLALLDAALSEAGRGESGQHVGVAGMDSGEHVQPGLGEIVQLGAEGVEHLIH